MPVVLRCILASDAALLLAEGSLFSPSAGLDPGQTAAAMVNRHFSLDRNPNARNNFVLIQRLVRNMLVLVHRNQNGGEKTFVAAPGRFSAARMIRSGVLALAFPHGVAMNGFSTGRAQDGSDIEVPNNKIMIAVPFAFTTRDSQLITLIHDMAHFLGGPDGSAELIDDPPGGRSAPAEIAKLPPERMALIAENYATFAFESAFRRPPIRMLV